MVKLTRLNQKQFWLNADLIETVEETPDVVVTLTNGHKYVVCESGQAVIEAIVRYRQKVHTPVCKEVATDEL
jgi:flagellar protein FlbD